MSDAAKVTSFAERLIALAEAYRADVATVIDQAKAADVDAPALRRLAAWMRKDEIARLEQEAVDDQYRFLAGLAPAPAELPAEGVLATAAALFADKLTIRAVAKEMGISVGKAHQLKIKAAAFNVHPVVNVNTPAHDPATGEVIEDAAPQAVSPASAPQMDATSSASVIPVPDGGVGAGTHSLERGNAKPSRDGEASADERDASASSSPPSCGGEEQPIAEPISGTPEATAHENASVAPGPQDPIWDELATVKRDLDEAFRRSATVQP